MSLPLLFAAFGLAAWVLPLAAQEAGYDPFPVLQSRAVTWTTPGGSSAASMPLGNGDIALNVWTESNGDILFYVAKSDAWSEQPAKPTGLPKVARVRLSLSPNPSNRGAPFFQRLDADKGEIEILEGTEAGGVAVRLWVDANRPVVHAEALSASGAPFTLRASFDPWRTEPQDTLGVDTVLPPEGNRLLVCHRNVEWSQPHVAGWTFGALLEGEGLSSLPDGQAVLGAMAPAARQSVSVHVLTTRKGSPDDWKAAILDQGRQVDAVPLDQARREHEAWWREFWQRSWIDVRGGHQADTVARHYALQRFVTACAGRGAYPVHFNGSLFTVDDPALTFGKDKVTGQEKIAPVTADYRAWGAQYWFQNTRPIYWARLKAGDFDMMQPFFRMYTAILKENAASVAQFYRHEGSYLAETSPFWGGIPQLDPAGKGSYTLDYFTPVLELTAMMLDYAAYTDDADFVRETLLPTADAGLTFFERHFGRDSQGRLLLDPDNSIEMFWKVRNPLPDIAGLRYVLDRLLLLPGGEAVSGTRRDEWNRLTEGVSGSEPAISLARREQWRRLRAIVPEIPVGLRDGKKVLLPFEEGQEAAPHNSENPELYAVHPFRLYGLGKPDLEVARDSFARRANRRSYCWHQDAVEAALLGLADEAQQGVVTHFTHSDPRLRFSAFWEKGHDYAPDEDNGGNGEIALQDMLLQCDGRRILLLPAWPADWDADFRLHAPGRTVVEGRVEKGKLTRLSVLPEERRADVVVGPELAPWSP